MSDDDEKRLLREMIDTVNKDSRSLIDGMSRLDDMRVNLAAAHKRLASLKIVYLGVGCIIGFVVAKSASIVGL